MKSIGHATVRVACVVCALCTSVVRADLSSTNVRLNVDVEAVVGSAVHTDQDPVSIGNHADGSLCAALAAALPVNVEVDAFAVKDGEIVFSTDISFRDGLSTYADEDLVAYNITNGTLSMYLPGLVMGIPPHADLDAVAFEADSATNILFSIDISADIPGAGPVDDEDILLYNWAVTVKAVDGATIGIPGSADIDALHSLAGGLTYFSLDVSADIDGQTGMDEDIWLYTVGATQLVAMTQVAANADLIGLDYPLDSDGDWLTDLEEETGQDEPATTYPGTDVALDPGAYTSEYDKEDTDGDKMTDGEEAAAGTNPRSALDRLAITSLGWQSGTNLQLVWLSVSNRVYEVMGTSNVLTGPFTNLMPSVQGAPGTNKTSATITNAPVKKKRYYRVKLKVK